MNDPILFWNAVALEANRIDHSTEAAKHADRQTGPTLSSRAVALVHLAMHDAFFGVAGVGAIPAPAGVAKRLWLIAPPAYAGANNPTTQAAAVAGAASFVLATLYSDQRPRIEQEIGKASADFGHDEVAFAYGRKIAKAVLATRENGAELKSIDADHVASPGRMRHRPDPANPTQGYHGVRYGGNATFAVTSFHNQAAPPGSAPASVPLYLKHYKEVQEHGAQEPRMRTPEETAIGLYWAYDGANQIGTPPRLYNQVLREIAKEKKNTAAQNARLFALANVAMGDAGIHAWYWKYRYDLWRPVVGIREHDGSTGPSAVADPKINPPADPFWLPLGAPKSNTKERDFTPPFPAYPSGHATFGAAAFEACRLFYGHANAKTKDTIGFELVSDELDGKTTGTDEVVRTRHLRKYTSLADAIYDNSVSRIFLGVHWRFDGTTGDDVGEMLDATNQIGGVPLGRAIARDIFDSGMQQQATPPRQTLDF